MQRFHWSFDFELFFWRSSFSSRLSFDSCTFAVEEIFLQGKNRLKALFRFSVSRIVAKFLAAEAREEQVLSISLRPRPSENASLQQFSAEVRSQKFLPFIFALFLSFHAPILLRPCVLQPVFLLIRDAFLGYLSALHFWFRLRNFLKVRCLLIFGNFGMRHQISA